METDNTYTSVFLLLFFFPLANCELYPHKCRGIASFSSILGGCGRGGRLDWPLKSLGVREEEKWSITGLSSPHSGSSCCCCSSWCSNVSSGCCTWGTDLPHCHDAVTRGPRLMLSSSLVYSCFTPLQKQFTTVNKSCVQALSWACFAMEGPHKGIFDSRILLDPVRWFKWWSHRLVIPGDWVLHPTVSCPSFFEC